MCIKDVVVVVLGGGHTWFELVYMCARVCVLRAFVSYYNIFYLEKKKFDSVFSSCCCVCCGGDVV